MTELVPYSWAQLERGVAAEYRKIMKRGLEMVAHAFTCGDMLRYAKKLVPHGEWTDWVERYCGGMSERTARVYMQMAEKADRSIPYASIQECVKAITYSPDPFKSEKDDQPAKPKPEAVDAEFTEVPPEAAPAVEVVSLKPLKPEVKSAVTAVLPVPVPALVEVEAAPERKATNGIEVDGHAGLIRQRALQLRSWLADPWVFRGHPQEIVTEFWKLDGNIGVERMIEDCRWLLNLVEASIPAKAEAAPAPTSRVFDGQASYDRNIRPFVENVQRPTAAAAAA